MALNSPDSPESSNPRRMRLNEILTNFLETSRCEWSSSLCDGWAACPNEPINQTKTNMKTCFHTLGAVVLATSLSFGQDKPAKPQGPGQGGQHGPGQGGHPKPEEIFAKLDADGDGNVTLEEFKKGPKAQEDPAKAEEIFKKIDANSDGNITLEEFKAHRPPPHGPGKGGPGKGGPGKGGPGKDGPPQGGGDAPPPAE